MPILVRPVREQLEHDRIIRLLQAKYRRKHEVAINVGAEQTTAVPSGTGTVCPDLVLYSQERGRRLQGTVEVETSESVNTLEAMAQWGPFSRLKVPFHLYVPPSTIDTVRRLCSDHAIAVAELWTYHAVGDDMRFTMVHRSPGAAAATTESGAGASRGTSAAAPKGRAAGSGKPAPAREAKRPTAVKAAKVSKPAKASKAATPVKATKTTRPAAGKPSVKAARTAKPAKVAKAAKTSRSGKATSARGARR